VAEAYVADVSIQGLKYKLTATATGKFVGKGELLPMDQIARTNAVDDPQKPCMNVESCRAINWYCFRNPHANAIGDSDAAEPV
jgi:hypothetical protein